MKIPLLAIALCSFTLTTFSQAAETITKTAKSNKSFSILSKALEATGLDKALEAKGSYTVFAPTDEAFMKLPKGTLATLLKPENKEQLANILKYHVVSGEVSGSVAVSLKTAKALNGENIKVSFEKAALYLNDSRVINTDIAASNGVIHVIDSVLIPKTQVVSKPLDVSYSILIDAIDVGVDLFNAGDRKACEKVYSIALRAVVAIKPKQLNEDDLTLLEKALAAADAGTDSFDDAWALRKAMNVALQKLKE